MTGKERLTVTVDRDLVEAAGAAVASGKADSLTEWVNLAMAERAAKECRLHAMADAVAFYEAEFGSISQAELVAQERADRRSAVIVRGARKRRVPRKKQRRA